MGNKHGCCLHGRKHVQWVIVMAAWWLWWCLCHWVLGVRCMWVSCLCRLQAGIILITCGVVVVVVVSLFPDCMMGCCPSNICIQASGEH